MDLISREEQEAAPLRLLIIIASTRPGRAGLPVGEWITERAREHGGFEVAVADLAELALPFMDEPNHPRLRLYTHQHTKDWSAQVEAADAFVFVSPEYNYGMSAPLKNAIDYLSQEWAYKPVAFVSYGGISGGTRAVQMIKQVVSTLKMVPLTEAGNIPVVNRLFDVDGRLRPTAEREAAATTMLYVLARWAAVLRGMRAPATLPVGR
jgi:NAD(P)H-dependent FMN reductase